MNEFKEAYEKILKENTQLHAQVNFYKSRAEIVEQKAVEMHTKMSALLINTLNGLEEKIKSFVKEPGLKNELIGIISRARPLVVRSQDAKSDTQS